MYPYTSYTYIHIHGYETLVDPYDEISWSVMFLTGTVRASLFRNNCTYVGCKQLTFPGNVEPVIWKRVHL